MLRADGRDSAIHNALFTACRISAPGSEHPLKNIMKKEFPRFEFASEFSIS